MIFIFCLNQLSCSYKKDKDSGYNIFSSEEYNQMDSLNKQNYLDSIHSNFEIKSNDSISRSILFDLSSEYYYLRDFKKSNQVNKKILFYSKKAKDTFSIARSYYYMGDCYEFSERDSAYYFYNEAEKMFHFLGNKEKTGNMLFKKAYLLFYDGNYLESEVQVSKALELLETTNNYQLLFSAYTILGANFDKLEEYNNALKYFQKAKNILVLLRKKDVDFDKKNNYSVSSALNLSNVYLKLRNYKKSIQELDYVNTKKIEQMWPNDYAAVIGNLGYAKMKSGDLKGDLELFNKALEIANRNNFPTISLNQYLSLGEYYLITKNNINSIFYLKESLRLAQKIKATDEIKTALRLLTKADPKNGFYYDEKYITVSDSLSRLQRKSRDKYARIEYETSVVEDANKVLTKKNIYIIIGSLFFILVLIGALIYRYTKGQKVEIAYRKQQQKAEEEIFNLLKDYQVKLSETKKTEQNRISKELHDSVMNKLYGIRLQLGILNDSDVKEIKNKRLFYIDVLQDIEQEIRSISHDLHSDVIDTHFNFISLLNDLIAQQNEIGKTLFTFEWDNAIDWDKIDSLVKIAIYRIVQEGVLNVIKYAHAKHCQLLLAEGEGSESLILKLKDDGKGFDINTESFGIGIKNMKERATTLNGNFSIISEYGKGTKIQVVFFK